MKPLFFNIHLAGKRQKVSLHKPALLTAFGRAVVGKAKFYLLFLLLVSQVATAGLWTDVAQTSSSTAVLAKSAPLFHQRLLNADPKLIAQQLQTASAAQAKGISASTDTIQLPMPDGSMKSYRVVYSPIIANGQAANYPQYKTYKLYAIDGSNMTGRVSITPLGFNAYIDTPKGTVLIDPVSRSQAKQYSSYYKHDYAIAYKDKMPPFHCGVSSRSTTNTSLISGTTTSAKTAVMTAAKIEGAMHDYRIAIAATADYSKQVTTLNPTNPVPLTKANVQAEIVNAVNRINQVYERDLGIHLNLVMNTNIIYLSTSTDPYYPYYSDPAGLLTENQSNLDNVIGSANYDVGQVFNTGGGGLAAIDAACDSSYKAQGETGLPQPVGDAFYIDFVAHELGHQFGADHTFNGTTNGCGNGNRNATTAYEPGSGSTIMAYAGTCGAEDIATNSDAVFHAGSVDQITSYTSAGGACYTLDTSGVGNPAPVVAPLSNYTIPADTDFELKGSATDLDNTGATDTANLLYRWDEMDTGLATNDKTIGTDLGSNPLFRSYAPTSSPDRTFPTLSDVLNNTVNVKGETLPMTTRTLHFRFTAEDNQGGSDFGNMQVSVDSRFGPFRVLQPSNSALTLDASQPQVIEWDPSCSTQAPINCANVDILYSTDNFATSTTLASGVPNNGSATVTLPTPTSTVSNAHIEIRCSNNIFYALSDQFSVSGNSGSVLTASGNPVNQNCGINTVYDVEPNNTVGSASQIQVPLSFNGTVNDTSDTNDYYVFIPTTSGTFTFTLSGYGTSDLNVYLLNASAYVVVDNVTTGVTTKTMSASLIAGQTYYVRVSAVNTSGVTTPYSMAISYTSTTTPPATTHSNSGGGSMGILALIFVILPVGLRRVKNRTFGGLVI